MGRADEHAPLLTRGRGSRLDNRLALWGDNSNVKRAGFIATLALLGLVALVVVRPRAVAAPYRLLFYRTPRVCRASRLAPSLPNRVSPSQTQGRTSHVNQVNSLNLRRESAEKLARRNNAYRDARCSVSWIVHTGALSGGAALEETKEEAKVAKKAAKELREKADELKAAHKDNEKHIDFLERVPAPHAFEIFLRALHHFRIA